VQLLTFVDVLYQRVWNSKQAKVPSGWHWLIEDDWTLEDEAVGTLGERIYVGFGELVHVDEHDLAHEDAAELKQRLELLRATSRGEWYGVLVNLKTSVDEEWPTVLR